MSGTTGLGGTDRVLGAHAADAAAVPAVSVAGSSPPPAGSRPRIGPAVRSAVTMVAPALVVLLIVLGLWLLVTYGLLAPNRRFLLPAPQDVVLEGILDQAARDQILNGLRSTASVAFTGLLISMVLGIGVAILMAQTRWLERSLYPWAVVLQTIPILAIVPLIGFWFGFGFWSRVIICVLISLFPVITNTLFGLRSADLGHLDLFALHGASRRQRLLKLQLPGAQPAIFTGLRIAAGLSVVGAIVGDFFFRQGEPGIGRLIDAYTARLESERLFAAIVFSSLLGLAVFWFFGLVGRLAVRSWHESAQDRS